MRVKTEENDKIYLKNDWHEDLIERRKNPHLNVYRIF